MAVTRAEIIHRRRASLGLTQEQLAERIGRNVSTVRRWEQGEATPPHSLIPTLARALQVSPRDLAVAFGEGEEEEPAPAGATRVAPVTTPSVETSRVAATAPDAGTTTPDPGTAEQPGPGKAAPAGAERRPPVDAATPPGARTVAAAGPPPGGDQAAPADGEQLTASELPIEEQATVAAPPAVPAAAAATVVAAPPQQPKRRSPLRRAPALNPSEGLSYLEDSRQRLRYWLRAALTIVAIIVLLMILVWAFGEFWDALGKVWDLFGEDPTPVTTPGAEF